MKIEIIEKAVKEIINVGEGIVNEVAPSLVQPVSDFLKNNSDEIIEKVKEAGETVSDFLEDFL